MQPDPSDGAAVRPTANTASPPLGQVTTSTRVLRDGLSTCFSAAERHLLLATRGIGLGVIDRMECAGVYSLRQLGDLGVDVVVDRICAGVGSFAWRNRRRALLRALAFVAATATRHASLSD
jgi:hypothetical protein